MAPFPRVRVYTDSEPAIKAIRREFHRGPFRAFDVHLRCVRDELKGTELYYVGTNEQLADLLTKPLDKKRTHKHCHGMGILLTGVEGVRSLEQGVLDPR